MRRNAVQVGVLHGDVTSRTYHGRVSPQLVQHVMHGVVRVQVDNGAREFFHPLGEFRDDGGIGGTCEGELHVFLPERIGRGPLPVRS